MKELYLSKVEKDRGEAIDRYIHIAEKLLPKSENAAIYVAFIRNMINGFGSDDITESVQISIYPHIDSIVKDVNEWLESFDSKKIISKLPSLINEYRHGDFNEIVKAEIEKIEKATEAKEEVKEETKDENKVEEATKEAKEEVGVENNKIPQIIKKYEDEIKNKFSEFGIDASDIDTLVKSFKGKDKKLINDFESFIRKAADDIINVLTKDNLIIDNNFIKDICTQLNIECTDKEIEEFLQIVSGVLSETSFEVETTLKNGVNKMIDAIIALIRKRVEESKEEKTEKPKEREVEKVTEGKTKEEKTEKPKEREVEKGTEGKTKEEKTEKNQNVEITANVDNNNAKKFANIVNMNIKNYTDIYASLKDSQQKYINLLRAFKAGDKSYVEEHIKLGDNKITIADYNELIAISKKITSTKSKRASKKETQPQQ